jgi:hemolysin D
MSGLPAPSERLALLARHREAFVQAWRDRRQGATLLLTADEADFAAPALSLAQRPVSPTLRVTAALLIAVVIAALAWATLGRIDIVANATGEVIPSSRTKTIASVETAVVRAIHVKEGQGVRAGEVLLELDATPFQADLAKASSEEYAAQLQIARARALILAVTRHRAPRLGTVAGAPAVRLHEAQQHLDGQYLDFTAKLAQLDSEIDRYARTLPVVLERERIYGDLLRTRDVSRDAWLEREQDRIDLEGRLSDAQDARAALVAQTEREAYDALTDATKTAASARQDAVSAASHAGWLTLRAPVDGTVQQLTVHTLGGVVQAAQPLMLIVPAERHVQVDAYLENKDVGFVRVGQSAQVKIATFDYTKYGTIPGQVISMSRDALNGEPAPRDRDPAELDRTEDKPSQGPRYLVRLRLDRSTMNVDGRTEQLIPGMSVNVEIKTGRRRVIDYVLSPILRRGTDSLHER